ncbi:helix-turn-helix transcriptional regulator [Georgenia yuyongxinii]|uniref:WYL domain-containing protein n=1 Tax=Georgenia yuyongxinii TaxID=2589797 RepID=A0A552WTE3_9MICO|nr:WYL domain-containing protein [Georgenia yuyongxinii]TRW45965.1 WYL domain-containing protein [Georgenia yuyongxinii]
MSDPTARALRLLTLLQTHRFWSGAELAERLGVTDRTLRRDIDRLRELGYRVAARPGGAGGYQLEGGSNVPPLLLDDDEAVAIAVGLRTAAIQGVGHGEQTSLSALAKIEQVLPRHLRRRVAAIQAHTVPSVRAETTVAADVLAQLALTCRDHERLRFRYVNRDGVESSRLVEPHSLVPHGRRWYFVAWDVDRADWRTFRIDRMSALLGTGVRFTPRELPAADAAEFVRVAHAAVRQRHEAVVHLRATMDQVRAHFGAWASEATEGPDGTVEWPIGGSSAAELLMGLLWIPPELDWTLTCSEEVAAALVRFRERLAHVL